MDGQLALLTILLPHGSLMGARHVLAGNITTCCCSEQLDLSHDWADKPLLALCVSATRGGTFSHAIPTSGWLGRVTNKTARVFHMKGNSTLPQGMHGLYFEGSSASNVVGSSVAKLSSHSLTE